MHIASSLNIAQMDLLSSPEAKKKKLKMQKNAENGEKNKLDLNKNEELKRTDRERKKEARFKQKQEAGSRQKLAEKRKQKREEMRRYRQKKKEKESKEAEKMKVSNRLKKKLAVQRTQAWRLWVKLQNKSNADEKATSETHQEHNDEIAQNSSFSSRSTKCRQVKKTKSTLPKTPTKRAEVVKSLIRSPTTCEILSKEGVIVTPECKRKLDVADQLISSLKENVNDVKQSNSSQSEKKSKQITNRTWWQKQVRKRRKDSLNDNIKLLVKKYYLSAEVSREVPNKREVVKVKTSDGKKETLQKHVMTMTLDNAFKNFKAINPNIKIGFTMFRKLKPENVRKISETSRRSCLCQVCCNIALKTDLNKDRLAAETLCPYQDTPSAPCLNRTCELCGTQKLTEYLKPIIEESKDAKVTWFKWELTEKK
ncbi:LOW QUALITY PROTEIN: hypothetical protein KUTeg_022023 [Tegillarca granosa]|uniref:Uncharacterized protein n=1 Tax=Tegillarca granosa TaxID=220873 RepID=A0ABQ9E587_TEGGR|nr:LOW QUALITY PROTEIN: hypothetical protein KUTeg_022023 [Tegillarca granosa]